jgi:hypothetical protein
LGGLAQETPPPPETKAKLIYYTHILYRSVGISRTQNNYLFTHQHILGRRIK